MNLKTRKNGGVIILLSLVLLFVIAYGYRCGYEKICGLSFVEKAVRNGEKITFPQGKIFAEVADTPAARAQGLSGRKSLAKDEGMLFVFDQPGRYGFWMKDMLFSIDMVWVSEDGTVVYVERNASPDSYFNHKPPETFVNTAAAKYVIELAAGQSDAFGLYLGTKIKIGE